MPSRPQNTARLDTMNHPQALRREKKKNLPAYNFAGNGPENVPRVT